MAKKRITDSDEMREAVMKVLDDPVTEHLVDIYFEWGCFAGIDFDSLAPTDPDRFEPSDLLALNLLDIRMGPSAIRNVLSGEFDSLLRSIPVDVSLWDDAMEPNGELWTTAVDMYRRIETLPDVGRTTTSKLLARKRPNLVPILDSVIADRLCVKGGVFWAPLREVLTSEVRERIDLLAPKVDVSTLRRLDVAVWMHGSSSGNAKKARAEALIRSE